MYCLFCYLQSDFKCALFAVGLYAHEIKSVWQRKCFGVGCGCALFHKAAATNNSEKNRFSFFMIFRFVCLFRNYDFLHGLCRSDDVDAAQRTIGGCYIAPDKVENAECHIALDAAIARHTHEHIGSRHTNGG